MSSRTSFSPFGSVLGLAAIVFVGGMAFLFSFGYLDMNTDNRSDASSRWCQEKGGFMETNTRGRQSGRCLCANGQAVTATTPSRCLSVSPGFRDPETPRGATASARPTGRPGERPGQPVIRPVVE